MRWPACESGIFGAIIRGVEAGVVGGLADMDPCSTWYSSSRRTTGSDRVCRFNFDCSPLGFSDFFGQSGGGSEIPILTYDDCAVVPYLVCCLDQVDRQADVDAFLLRSTTNPSTVDVDALLRQISQFVVPKFVPTSLAASMSWIWYAGVETYFGESAVRDSGGKRVSQFADVVTWPVVSRGRPDPSHRPSRLREMKEILAVNEDDGSHDKKHPPREATRSCNSRAGTN